MGEEEYGTVFLVRPQPKREVWQLVHIGAILGYRLANALEQLLHQLARSREQRCAAVDDGAAIGRLVAHAAAVALATVGTSSGVLM